jgi:predicted DNA binding CopG/RHH family protein
MPKRKVLKRLPRFASEAAERRFWLHHDSAEYVDWAKAKPLKVPNLKASTRTISIRLPESLIGDLKILANKQDIPYQSLLKLYVAERVEHELRER